MGKAYLVAVREFVENLRTKTFWIGILAFPAIFLIAIVVGRVMRQAKDVRTYAVVDHSPDQWLSRAIAERGAMHDMQRLLREAVDDPDGATAAQLRQSLQKARADLPDGHPLRALLDIAKDLDPAELERLQHGEMPSAATVAKLMPLALRWATDPHAAKQLTKLVSNLTLARYKRIEPEGLGDDPEVALNKRLQAGDLFAYFVIGNDPIDGSAGCRYVSNNLTDDDLRDAYGNLATEIVQGARIQRLKRDKNLTDSEARLLSAPLHFESRRVDEKTGEAKEVTATEQATQFAPVAFVYLLWIAVFTAAQMLLTNTVEEKSNRIIEVLLSSVSPLQLMTGKIFGIAATGLTVVGSWVLCAFIGVELLPVLLPGIPDNLGLTQILGDPLYIASFVGYFLGGYFFYAALLVGLGSVCNSLKEAQNLLQPFMVLLIVPLLAMVPVVNDPNGTLARVLTYVPTFTPFLMMNRAGGPPPTWEYALTTVIIVASILVAFWGAAKIFRIGILMTGKPPKLREMLGWLRAPVGALPNARHHHGEPPAA